MALDWYNLLSIQVDQTTDLHALAGIFPHIGVDAKDIRHFMKQKIEKLDPAAAKRAAFNVLPMQKILPMDSMQHIMSFQHHNRLKVVNKTFKKCFDRNQDIAKRSRQRIVDEHAHHFAPDITYDESTNQTYVVRPNGDAISESALSFGNIIPWTGNLKQLIEDQSNPGDRILMQNGHYVISDPCHCVDKMLQIIGIGDSVNIHVGGQFGLCFQGRSSHILLRNLNLSFDGSTGCGILVCIYAKMWMENCMLSPTNRRNRVKSIVAVTGSVASVKSCTFINHLVGVDLGGRYSDRKPSILDCTFTGCRHTIHSNVPIRCIGNLFIDNEDDATNPLDRGDLLKHNDKSVCIGNVFEGSNNEIDWKKWG